MNFLFKAVFWVTKVNVFCVKLGLVVPPEITEATSSFLLCPLFIQIYIQIEGLYKTEVSF